MSQLLTVSKKDPHFYKYLLGNFSSEETAIPIQSLNVNTDSETITFKIVKNDEIEKPSFLETLFYVLKADSWIYILFPMVLVLVKNVVDGSLIDQVSAMEALFAALFLFIAMNLRNEYVDHVSGVDRLHPNGPTKPIQLGWVRAYQIKNLAVVFFVLGFIIGLPIVLKYSAVLVIVGALTILGMYFTNYHSRLLKYNLAGEFVVFLLLGPLLTVGFEAACGVEHIDLETVMLGCLCGWFSWFQIHLKNFEALIVLSQAKFKNTMSRLGFEKSKKWLFIWWVLFIIGFNAYQFNYSSIFWCWILLFASILCSVGFLATLRQLQSPAGSGMSQLIRDARYMSVFILAFWFVENLWYLYAS